MKNFISVVVLICLVLGFSSFTPPVTDETNDYTQISLVGELSITGHPKVAEKLLKVIKDNTSNVLNLTFYEDLNILTVRIADTDKDVWVYTATKQATVNQPPVLIDVSNFDAGNYKITFINNLGEKVYGTFNIE